MATVRLDNLRKVYDNGYVGVAGASFEVAHGELLVLVGPSGCGKSTLLRAVNRIYELYPGQRAEGEVVMDGENILKAKDMNLLRARVGMVFQKPTPFPMTIYDNVAFGIKLYERMPRSELDGRIENALQRAALWGEVKDLSLIHI